MSEKLNIAIGSGAYAFFQRTDYRAWWAIAEFIDNSIQSFLNEKTNIKAAQRHNRHPQLKIDIEISNNIAKPILRVIDNAGGIRRKDFDRAFSPAKVPPDANGLNEFGMGMKLAACWFGSKWKVITSAVGEGLKYTVKFDINQIVETDSDTPTVDVLEEKERNQNHYTIIEIELDEPLSHYAISHTQTYLADIYRRYLSEEKIYQITFRGEKLEPLEVPVLKARFYPGPKKGIVSDNPSHRKKEWKLKIPKTQISDDISIKGWIAISSYWLGRGRGRDGDWLKNKSRDHGGLSFYRRGRLIIGKASEDSRLYKPEEIFGKNKNESPYCRIFGEFDIIGGKVFQKKNGIKFGEKDEQKIISVIKQHFDSGETPFSTQAKFYGDPKKSRPIPPPVDPDTSPWGKPDQPPDLKVIDEVDDVDDLVAEREKKKTYTLTDPDGYQIEVGWSSKTANAHLFTHKSVKSNKTSVIINLSHNFFTAYVNPDDDKTMEAIVHMIAAYVRAEIMVKNSGDENLDYMRQCFLDNLSLTNIKE